MPYPAGVSSVMFIWCLFAQWLFWTTPLANASPSFKILTVDPGVYRVSFEDLNAIRALPDALPSSGLEVRFQGEAIPLWVADGGDGIFGAGDHFEFRARPLRGELGYYHEYTQTSTYFLSLTGSNPARIRSKTISTVGTSRLPSSGRGPFYLGKQHLETDTLLMRFQSNRHEPHEIWYWQNSPAPIRTLSRSPSTRPIWILIWAVLLS